MKKHFALWLITSGLLASFNADGGARATDPPLELTAALKATSPNPALGDQAQVFGRIVGTWDVGSKQTRWSFNDIRPDSFVWRDEASNDGKTWKLQAEYQMKRRRAN
jgi:hypothetical protein